MKIALGIEYQGTNYYGWQRQENVRSIQEQLENALSIIANEKIEILAEDQVIDRQYEMNVVVVLDEGFGIYQG